MLLSSIWNKPTILALLIIWAANAALGIANFAAPPPGGVQAPAWRQSEPAGLESVRAPVAPASAASATAARADAVRSRSGATAATESAADSAAAADPLEPVAPGTPVLACRAWGPFDDAAEASSVARALGLAPADYELVASEVVEQRNYLVRVRPVGGRVDAGQVVAELTSLSIDAHLIAPGASEYTVAVGVFSNLGRAETQQRRLIDLGYDAAVEPLERTRQILYLLADVAMGSNAKIPDAGACADIAP